MPTQYNLEKFENGPVYFLKSNNLENNTASIEAIINIVEIRDQAEYQLNVILCKNYNTQTVTIHGSYLNPQSIIQIAANLLTENPDIYDNIIRTTDIV